MISNSNLRMRLVSSYLKLSFLDKADLSRLRKDHVSANEEYGEEEEDGWESNLPYPVETPTPDANEDSATGNSFNSVNKSRYKLEPGHGQHLSDLLGKTAARIRDLVVSNG